MSRARKIDYPAALWRRRWLIVPFAVLGMIVGLAAFQRMTRVYRARATVSFIDQALSSKVYGKGRDSRRQPNRARAINRLVAEREFLERVAGRLGLKDADLDALRDLHDRLTVSTVDQERFRFSFIHQDAEKAALGATTFAASFVEEHRRRKVASALASMDFVRDEMERIFIELNATQGKLSTYQMEHKGELPSDRESHRAERGFLRTRRAELAAQLENRRGDRESRIEMLNNPAPAEAGQPEFVATVPGADRPLPLGPRQQKAAELQRQLADAKLRYTERHPKVVRLRASLDRLLQDLRTHPLAALPHDPLREAPEVTGSAQTVVADQMSGYMRMEIARLDTEIRDLEGKKQQTEDQIAELERLIEASFSRETDIATVTASIELLRQRLTTKEGLLQTLETDREVTESDMDERYVLQSAAGVPLLPYRPDIVQLLIAGLLGGLGLGVGLALSLEFFDRTLRTAADIEALLDVDVVATIQHMGHVEAQPDGASHGRRGRKNRTAAHG